MIEPIMYLAIGFLISMLFGLMILPLVHNRAARLTTRRLEAATPLSMAEIQADKDQLRAEFAMSARRLEMSVEQLKNKTTSQLAELGKKSDAINRMKLELGKKSDAINRMKLELGEKNATIFSLESRETSVRDQLRATEDEFATKTEALRTAEAALAEKRAELSRITTELADRSMAADTRQVELVAVQTQIEALKNRVGDAEGEFANTQQRLESHRSESETASRELAVARGQVDTLNQRVTDLDGQLATQTTEAQSLGQRIKDLQDNLALQNRLLAQRDDDNARLQQAHDAAVLVATAAREELAAGGTGKSAALDKIRAEKTAVEEQLRLANEDRARLQGELGAIQQQAESSWATERMENALLRERINDIAAEVAKLAITLEGPNSVIESMLSADPVMPPGPASAAEDAPAPRQAEGTLADRIRALQSHASRTRLAGTPVGADNG